ncbi:RNA polymerase sigma factor [Thermomonospora cellulosilytica]|uniref:RNA polymerase sigma-70 factor (ECF subfamily) n=1 Tax=Thermomonospora cellulosilytica TaxID=1411118 RepID=A0A7W3N2U0_9ACTN|nr:sigma-70 family RNA polymerase sigma factor [Thermomonospora cellulosilytica]MBA9006533.1 RNA polymerase sigma-70 factor (ECF subfamily) [Thermomonospora cellulosilytica]
MDDPRSRFTRLYDEHYRRVLAYALTHADQGVAEDVVSETFLVAWRRLDDLPAAELPWLLGVARNMLRRQRDGGHRRRALAERAAELTTPADLAAWDVAEHVVEREAALDALACLPERDVELLTLITWHGLSPREAARVLGCSAATLFVRLHRARKRLARALEAAPARSARPLRRVAGEAAR